MSAEFFDTRILSLVSALEYELDPSMLKTFEELDHDLYFLECLRMAGVDNWDGLDHAIDIFNES